MGRHLPPAPSTTPLDESLITDVAIIEVQAMPGRRRRSPTLPRPGSAQSCSKRSKSGTGAGRNNGMVIPALSRAYPKDLRRRFGTERGNRFAGLIADSASFTFGLIRRHGIDCEAVQQGWR